MAEYYIEKAGYSLIIDGTYENTLEIGGFAQMMKNPSYCYKFYWLEAIVDLISRGITETTFDELINEMIANAWYSVREFHIHLSGVQADGWCGTAWSEQSCSWLSSAIFQPIRPEWKL